MDSHHLSHLRFVLLRLQQSVNLIPLLLGNLHFAIHLCSSYFGRCDQANGAFVACPTYTENKRCTSKLNPSDINTDGGTVEPGTDLQPLS